MSKKLSVVLLLLSLVALLQANSPTHNDIDAKVASLMKQKEENDLKEALEELDHILKHRKPNVKQRAPTLADFKESKDAPEEYDYLIAGGGSAGLLMAYRLSEEPTNQILVVEQGGEASKISQVPALDAYCSLSDFADMGSFEPQPNAGLAHKDGRLVTCKGCALGGSSTLNSMSIAKGHTSEYSKFGDGWCYDDIIDYFKKGERTNITGTVESAYHGFDGPIHCADSCSSPLADAFISCGLDNGYKEIDYNAIFDEGFARVMLTTDRGKRQCSADAYLPTIRQRPNVVMRSGKVIKILIDKNKKAYGFQYAVDGLIYTALARKEVLVCCGSFGSPVLLMNSGIGPAGQLQHLGIKVIQDLPVGKNLRDRYKFIGIGLVVNSSAPAHMGDLINDKTKKKYLEGYGPLVNPRSKEALAIKKINSATPNVLFRLDNRFWAIDKGVAFTAIDGFTDKFYHDYLKAAEGKKMCSIVPILTALSVGQLKLRSNNPFDQPILIGNYYSHPHDKKNMVDAIKFVLHLIKCESFKKFGLQLYEVPVPGCEKEKGDDYWYCAIKYLTVPHEAYTGTCKMGPADDPTSVVDLNLQVIGVEGLRVADSSVIPCAIFAHAATRTVIAEKAADLVKAKDGLVVQKVCGKHSSEE